MCLHIKAAYMVAYVCAPEQDALESAHDVVLWRRGLCAAAVQYSTLQYV